MVKEYKKPMVSVDAGLAEGIYAASGAENTVTLSKLSEAANWGNGNGQLKFTADFSALASLSNLTLIVKFNNVIQSAWGTSAGANVNGQEATFTWYSAPSSVELFIQVEGCLSSIAISGYVCYNS